MAKRTIYRDRKTGRFSKKSKWDRDTKDRYVRQRINYPKRKIIELPEPEPEPEPITEVHEWIIGFSYDKSGRSFDIIVTARTEAEANQVARDFLRSDRNGSKIAKAGFTGWSQRAAMGNATNEESGEAEYREESEE